MSEANGALNELYEIQDLQARANEKTDLWLRKRGWSYTCQTPGARWMWTREWNGKYFLVSQSTAVNIQEIWDTDKYVQEFPEAVDE